MPVREKKPSLCKEGLSISQTGTVETEQRHPVSLRDLSLPYIPSGLGLHLFVPSNVKGTGQRRDLKRDSAERLKQECSKGHAADPFLALTFPMKSLGEHPRNRLAGPVGLERS